MAGTAELADEVARHTDRVDALVCCAGIFALRPEWTDEGLERTFALNYLSRFLLVRRLEPLLTASPSARVVLVANAGAYRDRLDLDDPHYRRGRPGMRVASRTQFANDLLAVELAERYRGSRSPRPACSRASCERTCSATVSEYPGPSPPSSRRSRPGWVCLPPRPRRRRPGWPTVRMPLRCRRPSSAPAGPCVAYRTALVAPNGDGRCGTSANSWRRHGWPACRPTAERTPTSLLLNRRGPSPPGRVGCASRSSRRPT